MLKFTTSKTTTLMLSAIVIGLSTLANTAPAAAFEIGLRCEVKATKDGFVALRSKPSIKSKLIRKIQRPSSFGSADAGTYDFSTNYNVTPQKRVKNWVLVYAALYNGKECDGEVPCTDWEGKGYIRADLIDSSSCSNAG